VHLGAVEALPVVGVALSDLTLVEHHREDELAGLLMMSSHEDELRAAAASKQN
jgi:hypothetical protein